MGQQDGVGGPSETADLDCSGTFLAECRPQSLSRAFDRSWTHNGEGSEGTEAIGLLG